MATKGQENVGNGDYTLQRATKLVLAGQQLVRALDFVDYLAESRPELHGEETANSYKQYSCDRHLLTAGAVRCGAVAVEGGPSVSPLRGDDGEHGPLAPLTVGHTSLNPASGPILS